MRNNALIWDDSALRNPEAERIQDMQDVQNGILNKYEYRMKWYSEDEQTAKAKIETATPAQTNNDWFAQR